MKRGQRSPGIYACPKPNSSPLPEYSIELRFVAPMASATAATPVFCCMQPTSDTVRAITATSFPNTRIFGSPLDKLDFRFCGPLFAGHYMSSADCSKLGPLSEDCMDNRIRIALLGLG